MNAELRMPNAECPQPADELGQLVAFCRAHGAPCFVAWPENILREYLCFHAEHGSLAVVRRAGEVVGMAVGWQCAEREIERHWQVTDPAGDAFYFAHAVVTDGGAWRLLVAELGRRIPNWTALKLWARRGPKGLRRYQARMLARLARGRMRVT